MPNIYCPTCGAKVEYSLEKPKFCTSCGSPMDITHSNRKTSSLPTKEEKIEKIPDIKNLDADIDLSFGRRFTFEELAQIPEEEVNRPKKQAKKGDTDPIKESMDDCSPGRRHSIGNE